MIRLWAISARVAKPQYIVRVILGGLVIRFGLKTGLRIVATLAGPLRMGRMRMRVRMRIAPLGTKYAAGLPDGR
jgi:hypothetical protein